MDAKLVMFKTNGQRKDFPLQESVTVIGRGENCDLRIPLVSVSRRHCELAIAGDQIKAKDLASSNGTYVNNERITEKVLTAGDRIVVGPVVFTVQIDGVPEEIQQVKTKGQEAAEAKEAGVVDLEPDVTAKAEQSKAPEEPKPATLEPTQELDPIAALEALAAESKKPEEKKDK